MLSVTANLLDDADPASVLMVPRAPSPDAGPIGQPSPSLLSHVYTRYVPSNTHTYTMKTPNADAAEVDLAALIAEARRQHEPDKSRIDLNGRATEHAQHRSFETGVIEDGLVGAIGQTTVLSGNGEHHRRWASEEWDRIPSPSYFSDPAPNPTPAPTLRSALPYHVASPRQIAPGPITPSPHLSRMIPSQVALRATGTDDPAGQVSHHLAAIQGLLAPMMAGAEEMQRLKKEVEMWKGEWGKVDREKKRLEGVVQGLEERQGGHVGPGFTAVLIDGDGLIFQDHLLQAGFQGGQLAARTLLSSLPTLASHTEMSPTTTFGSEITVDAGGAILAEGKRKVVKARELRSAVVMVFLNKSGLGTTLVKAGVVPAWGVYDSFWQGFSASHELFTVIDVGPGKEATDAKIREYLRLYAKHVQCEMIILGASHDNGYANILSSLHTESRLSKLLLLKGYTDLAQQLRQYSSRVVSIPDLFRTTKMPTAPISFSSAVQSSAPSTPTVLITTGNDAASPKAQTKNLKKIEEAKMAEEGSTSPSLSLSADDDDGVDVYEWDEMRQTAMLARKKPTAGVDEWTEAGKKGKKFKSKEGKPGVKVDTVRNLKPRPCHTFYLSPLGCKAGDDCGYAHHYNLSNAQLGELKRLAKEIICPYVKNNKCHFTEEECVYGHRCPRMEKCTFGETCRFNVLPNGHGEEDGLVDRVRQVVIS